MAEVDRLGDLATELHGAVEAALTTHGRETPERSGLSHGEVADECDQLNVRLMRTFVGTVDGETGALRTGSGYGIATEWEVRLMRCLASVAETTDPENPPDVALLEQDALDLAADGWAIYKGLVDQIEAGETFDGCTAVNLGALEPVGPAGGLGGWTLAVRVQL